MADIVVSEFMDKTIVEQDLSGYNVLFDPGLVDKPEELLAELADARALIVRNRTQVNVKLLAAAPKLEVVGRLGVGLDNIDLEACKARGIPVYPATGANDLAVAEYVITATMMLLRNAFMDSEAVARGAWPRERMIGSETRGKRLGLIGLGANARTTAGIAAALGMQVAAYDPYLSADAACWREVERLDLNALLESSDVVSIHVPLTRETHHLIDATALERIKSGAILINAARGGIVDETAMLHALRKGRLLGAALDVFESEPLTSSESSRFEGIPNLILTPHIAGVTKESNVRVSRVTVNNVLQHLNSRH